MRKPDPRGIITLAVVAAALLLKATAGLAATPLLRAGEGPEGKALYLWDVNQSWPGRDQADARLDRPVRMWRTAVPLAEVFAQVREQTGAHLACWPAADDDERICVTLYLTPEQPPSLPTVTVSAPYAPPVQDLRRGVGRFGCSARHCTGST